MFFQKCQNILFTSYIGYSYCCHNVITHSTSFLADQVDFRGGTIPLILLPGETRVCFNSDDLPEEFIIDDDAFEFTESFLLNISPANVIASRFVQVIPGLDTAIVYIVDDEGTPLTYSLAPRL